MSAETIQSRRNFIAAAGAMSMGLLLSGPGHLALAAGEPKPKEEEIRPVEDLMREHGALRRVLLIYEEVRQGLETGKDLPPGVVAAAAGIIKRFVEDYHEKLEENELFPRFEKAGKLVDLVKVLRTQHQAGRQVTTVILAMSSPVALADSASRHRLAESLGQFLRMYRPHAAREDTVLFPDFPSLMPEKEYQALGEKFEAKEKELFGKNGFENIVSQIADLEKQLGIYDLAQFTPHM